MLKEILEKIAESNCNVEDEIKKLKQINKQKFN